jgi:hypothetical protein
MKININKQHSTAVETFRNQRLPWLRLSVRVIAGLLGTISLMFPGACFAGAQDLSPAIRVRVDNYTLASPAVIATAEREASRILGAAGLRSVWLNCPETHFPDLSQDPCQEPLETTDIVLRVVYESIQNKFHDSVFGFAVQPVLATVYYEYPVRLAKRDDAEFELPVILGCVIAHEIGHLLLGSHSHSDSGIMQPRWECKQVRQALTGALLFTPDQAKQIQAEARTRMNSEITSLKSQSAKQADH